MLNIGSYKVIPKRMLNIGSYKVIPKSLTIGSIILEQDEEISITRTDSAHTVFIRNKNNQKHIVPTTSLLYLLERTT